VSYHIYVFCPGNVDDVEAVKRAFADLIEDLDDLKGEPARGSVAGGDWIGNDRAVANSFELSAEQVRAARELP
jgi:hypothetical protein